MTPGSGIGAGARIALPAPVVANVWQLRVNPGDRVEVGTVVAVLESMKMEMQITAPRGGVVKRVAVAPGAAVKVDELMVEFV